jgi:hypothetical protein
LRATTPRDDDMQVTSENQNRLRRSVCGSTNLYPEHSGASVHAVDDEGFPYVCHDRMRTEEQARLHKLRGRWD